MCGVLYADNLTDSMAKAIEETWRRAIQLEYNESTDYAAADSQKIH